MFAQDDQLLTNGLMLFATAGGLVIALLLVIAYLITLGQALSAVPPKIRKLPPGLVWLNLIPVFNIFWLFLTVVEVSRTLKRGYAIRRVQSTDSTFGLIYGLLAATMYPVSIGLALLFFGMANAAKTENQWLIAVALRVATGGLLWLLVFLHGRQVGKLRKRLLTAEPGPVV